MADNSEMSKAVMQVARPKRFSTKPKALYAILGYLTIALLLLADFAFARVGLPMFAPVSATITVPGTLVLIASAALVFIVQVVRQPPAMGSRHAISVGAWLLVAVGAACATYVLILQLGRPVAENQAMTKLANAIATPELLEFDPRLTEFDRRVVVQSKPSAWQLYFSSPMFIGYDFNLPTGDGRYIGARVTPATIWSSSERVWVFPEVSRSTDRPAR